MFVNNGMILNRIQEIENEQKIIEASESKTHQNEINQTFLIYYAICLKNGINNFQKDIKTCFQLLEKLKDINKYKELEFYSSFIGENYINQHEKDIIIKILSEEILHNDNDEARIKLFDVILLHELYDDNQTEISPQHNKLIQKVEPICTFAVTGENYINQMSYKCHTCSLDGSCTICDVCATNCHKNHDIYNGNNCSCYCDCGSDPSKCKCLPEKVSMRCTCEQFLNESIDQPMYKCNDCKINDEYCLCQYCAMNCHKGHNLTYLGTVKNSQCNCK